MQSDERGLTGSGLNHAKAAMIPQKAEGRLNPAPSCHKRYL